MTTHNVKGLKERSSSAIDAHADELRDIAAYLREHPELGYQEKLALAKLSDYLERQGFAVERGIGGLDTAFRATLDSGRDGPVIAFLAEYDALPDVGHGCGHNLISAGALGGALGVQAVLDELGGKVIVLGTPCEEFQSQPEGKVKLLDAGEFAGLDACLMLHPSTRTCSYNSSLAFVALRIAFHGRTAHAAADPWNGLNALDGVILTFNHVNALRQHVRPDVRMHGVITDGGLVPNIIPERAVAEFMLRAPTKAEVDELEARFRGCVEGAALATGTKAEIEVLGRAADVRPYPTLQALTKANFESLGVPISPPYDSRGSTDFGNVSYHCPAESFYITLDAGDMPWHSREVAEATGREPALRMMIAGAKVLAMDAIDLLADPGLLEQARQEMPGRS